MSSSQAPDSYHDVEPFEVEAHGLKLTFFPAGKDRFDALLDVIDKAQSSLKIFYYMFQDDSAGEQVRDALVKAATRGVSVQLIVDRFGTDAENSFFDPIVDNGGQFSVFSPRRSRRYLIRNHQKILIADETVAMVGGFNVSEHYFAPPTENGWCDLGCKMTGPAVDDLLRWYHQLQEWTSTPDAQFRVIRRMIKDWDPGDGPVRLTLGGPTRAENNWARMVKRDLAKASRLDLVMAYFSPPRSFRRLIGKVAQRSKARLMLAGKSDNSTTVNAARALYGSLLRRKARIYEFQPCKLHMKLLVIDDIVYFGSANFDHRSIRLNLELMFRIEDAGLAGKMRDLIDAMQEASIEVTPEIHGKRRSIWNEFKWLTGWFMVTTMDYTVSRSLNFSD
ncbi:cardiolipin synthase B [Pontixanthobacter aestiaquae]|uniref:Phospholipase D n=1 Tax=Pontixanthobacter aestiaquae TaxID=1509367 RepID=A0A844Z6G3_9SPHN|nr:cardiolipin synthase B [Pontixanthobacter aestiaquae]MDN3646572.1 cardiolipin synthase B [Pontixanthobacter aestiaquae]MXO82443.1 cardiolipin synthase B [Pontixanthobacter aestiaquae]